MISGPDWILKNLDEIDKKTLFQTILDLEELLKSKSDMYQKIIIDRDNKIESLIKERENYKELYFKNKEELDQLKDKSALYLDMQLLSKRLKEANSKEDYLESQNLKLKEVIKTLEDQRDSYRKLAESFADMCRSTSIDLSAYVKASPQYEVENLHGQLSLLDKGYYKLLVLSDDKVKMTILGNVEYNYALGDFTLKEFDTYYCVFKLGSVPFMKINKFTREVTRL